ncbi:hypothetical protein G7054_g6818 [Neopestalotiopsis clavispora]|nr:hypothetical protein G7054_g6818 [Neopestalotiopsis clavispora]
MAQTKQLTVFVTLHIKPELIEDFKAAHRPVWNACAAEPQCLFFDVWEDPENAGHFRFVEVWNESKEWFEKEQLTKPYYASMWPKSKATWAGEPKIEYFERSGEASIYRKAFLDQSKLMD